MRGLTPTPKTNAAAAAAEHNTLEKQFRASEDGRRNWLEPKLETYRNVRPLETRNLKLEPYARIAISGFCRATTSPMSAASTPACWSSANSASASPPATEMSSPPAVCGS